MNAPAVKMPTLAANPSFLRMLYTSYCRFPPLTTQMGARAVNYIYTSGIVTVTNN